jgi:hypothetical protein
MINNVQENGCCTVHEMVESTCMRNFRAQQGVQRERERVIVVYCLLQLRGGNRIFKKLIKVYSYFLDVYQLGYGDRRRNKEFPV